MKMQVLRGLILVTAGAISACSTLPPNTPPVSPELAAACKEQPKGCMVVLITSLEDVVNDAFNLGRLAGAMSK